jgi:diaminohydroxyphosphoribosylaminopyrimidine deaminase/5-amino-6-(5-phosphoribosylamino)uracil reductase
MSPTTDADENFMRRALRLAMNGRGRAEPNPMVGCVIVEDGRIIGEGWHKIFGGPHAEPIALANCSDSTEGATAYVTLEPCCHTNKKTPPCAPRLIEAAIRRIVIGCFDPNPHVNGKGVAMLRDAGVRSDGPLLEAQARQLIAPFLARVTHHRPYTTLKWAQTADGKVAGPGGTRLQISNPAASRQVHLLRARCDAILVGVNTAIIDDPLLTARDVENPRPLLRAVVDTELRLPPDSKLARSAAEGPVIVYTGHYGVQEEGNRLAGLESAGVSVVPLSVSRDDRPMLEYVLQDLAERNVTHLLVETGPTLATSFFRDELADRLWVFRSPNAVNDSGAPAAPAVPTHFIQTGRVELDGDTLTEYLNPRSAVFFAPEPSADLVLAAQQHA